MSGPDPAGMAAGAEALAATFLSTVWPSQGPYFIATPFRNGGYKHHLCNSVSEAARLAVDLDSECKTVYFALASFKAPYVNTPQQDGTTKRQYRTKANIRALRAFWFDLDCGTGKDFETQAAAVDALIAFCDTTALPRPLCVLSGNGIHAYWVITDDVALDAWQPVADKLKALTHSLKFPADPSRTADPTSVLRPAGTFHRKDPNNPKLVQVINEDAKPVSFPEFLAVIEAACAQHAVSAPRVRETAHDKINAQFGVQQSFPACSAHKVADRCQQLRRMRDTKGCVPEPVWYSAIQLMCHALEGDELIHEWSNGYAGYSHEETERKITQIRSQALGPTLCSTFEGRNPDGCDGCPFKGKISSPVQLGADAPSAPALPAEAQPTQVATALPSNGGGGFGPAVDPTTARLLEINQHYAWVDQQAQIFRFRFLNFIDLPSFKSALANKPPLQYVVGETVKTAPIANEWLKWPGRREHSGVVYEPGGQSIVGNCVNLWRGWGCAPMPGDVTPWTRLLDAAFGQDAVAHRYFEQWVANQIQHPGEKLNTACVLWSAKQGVGKSLIGETIGHLFGENFVIVTAMELHSPFNSWAKAKQFVLGEENSSHDRRADADRLKHLITGEQITINEKYQPAVSFRNTLNFLFTSNHPNAFHLDVNDRRFFVWEFAGDKLPDAFFAEFVEWRDRRGGLAALMHYFQQMNLTGFNAKAAAPTTGAKLDMIEASRSDLERWLHERVGDAADNVPSEVVYVDDLILEYLIARGHRPTSTAVGTALMRMGVRTERRVTIRGKRKKLRAIRRPEYWAAAPDSAWATEYVKGETTAAARAATVPQ